MYWGWVCVCGSRHTDVQVRVGVCQTRRGVRRAKHRHAWAVTAPTAINWRDEKYNEKYNEMSKHGVLLGAFYCCHMLRSQPRCVGASATRQALTTSNAEGGNFWCGHLCSGNRGGRDLKLNDRRGTAPHICLLIIAAVKVSIKARMQGLKPEQFFYACVIILIPDFSTKCKWIHDAQMDSASQWV